jgi:hypothetical protein
MNKFDLKPGSTPQPERLYLASEEYTGSVQTDTAINALKTLAAMLEKEPLSPADVKDVLTQAVYALQGLASQVKNLEDAFQEYKDNFNLYANQSLEFQTRTLEVQTRAKEREKVTLDLLNKELQS